MTTKPFDSDGVAPPSDIAQRPVEKCVKCGHLKWLDENGRCKDLRSVEVDEFYTDSVCKCECDFSQPIPLPEELEEIRERMYVAGLQRYNEGLDSPIVCPLCNGAMDDHRGECLLADMMTLLTALDSRYAAGLEKGIELLRYQVEMIRENSNGGELLDGIDFAIGQLSTLLPATYQPVEEDK